jgi:hypothetical protein
VQLGTHCRWQGARLPQGGRAKAFGGLANGGQFAAGTFAGVPYVGTITYNPMSVVLSNLDPVPEPAAWRLAGGAAAAWAWRRRPARRR